MKALWLFFFDSTMSSTVRVFIEKKRIATGKPWKNQFLQVYPTKAVFPSEAEWRSAVYQSVLSSLRFEVKKIEKKASQPKPQPLPQPQPQASSAPAKQAAAIPPPSPKTNDVEQMDWVCGWCNKPAGNDHRMCICRGYQYSVEAWENGRIFPKKTTPKATNSPLSLEPKDWVRQVSPRQLFQRVGITLEISAMRCTILFMTKCLGLVTTKGSSNQPKIQLMSS